MIRKFLKLIGVGLASGAACRLGSMLADALFPKGLGGFLSRFNKPKDEEENQAEKSIFLTQNRG